MINKNNLTDSMSTDLICYKCQGKGHIAKFCVNKKVKSPYDYIMTHLNKANTHIGIALTYVKKIEDNKWKKQYLQKMMDMDRQVKNIKKLKKELAASKIISLENDLEKSSAISTKAQTEIKEIVKEEDKKESKLSMLLNEKDKKKKKKKKIKKEEKKEENKEIIKEESNEKEIKIENGSISSFSSSSIDTKFASQALEIIKQNVIFTKVVRLRKGAFGLTNSQYTRVKEYIEARLSIKNKPSKDIETMDMFVLATNLHLWAKKYGTPLMKQLAKDILQLIHDYEEYAQPDQPESLTVPAKKIVAPDGIASKIIEKQKADLKMDGTTTKEVQKLIKKEEQVQEKLDSALLKEIMRDEKRQKEIKQNRKWNEKRDQIRENNIERRFKITNRNQKYYQNRNYKLNNNRFIYQKNKDRTLHGEEKFFNFNKGKVDKEEKYDYEAFSERVGCQTYI